MRYAVGIKQKVRGGLLGILVLLAAGFAAHAALSSGGPTVQSAAPYRPLADAALPAGLSDAASAAARSAGLDPRLIAEAGASIPGSPYRATFVVRRRGITYVAFANPVAVTSFGPVTSRLAGMPMRVLQGTAGTAKRLKEVGISIVVNRSVALVIVETADGTTNPVVLTRWPNTPYASASVSATVSREFPKLVRAYDAAGVLVAEHKVDLKPACAFLATWCP
jgi:hypothetical protein